MKTFLIQAAIVVATGIGVGTYAAPWHPQGPKSAMASRQVIPAGSHFITLPGSLGCFGGTTALVPTWTPGKFLGRIDSCDGEIVYHLDLRTGQSTLDVIEGLTLVAYYSGSGGNLQLVKSNGGGWPGGVTIQ